MILTIDYREFKSLFLSPLAWSILVIIQFILAYLFLTQIEAFVTFQAQLAYVDDAPGISDVIVVPLFTNAAVILLLVSPLLTMRLISEERRNKTLSLLLTAPLLGREIILGKFLGIWALLLLIIFIICFMPLSLTLGGDLDEGLIYCNILALSLLTAAFSALGLYTSCLARHPTVAALTSFGLLLLLWIIGSGAADNHGQPQQILQYISLQKHFQNLQSGVLNSMDVGYFVVFITVFLILTIRRLEHERLQK